MPVQRLYNLPYCTLLLEGLSNSSALDPMGRQSLDILIRFECRLLGQAQTLVGGRELLESLAKATGSSVQSWISGVQLRHSGRAHQAATTVQLTPVDDNTFNLTVPASLLLAATPAAIEGGTSESAPPLEMKLPLVQVFDLVEALDQLAADSQTLANLELQPQPLSRQVVTGSQAASQQAIPLSLATGGLAAAAAVLFMLPVPTVRRPPEPKPENPQETVSPNRSPSPSAPGISPTPTGTTSPSLRPNTPTSAPTTP